MSPGIRAHHSTGFAVRKTAAMSMTHTAHIRMAILFAAERNGRTCMKISPLKACWCKCYHGCNHACASQFGDPVADESSDVNDCLCPDLFRPCSFPQVRVRAGHADSRVADS